MKKDEFLKEFTAGNNIQVYCKTNNEAKKFLKFLIENGVTEYLGGNKIDPTDEKKMYKFGGTYYQYLKVDSGPAEGFKNYNRDRIYSYGLEYGKSSHMYFSKKSISFSDIEM